MENTSLMLDMKNMSPEEIGTIVNMGISLQINNLNVQLKNMAKETGKIKGKIGSIENDSKLIKSKLKKVQNTLNDIAINRFQCDELDDLMKKRIYHFVGAINSYKYVLFFGKFKSILMSEVKKAFGVNKIKLRSIKDLKKSDFEKAKELIKKWFPDDYVISKIISDWLIKRDNGDLTNTQEKHLNRYLNLKSKVK